MGANAQTAVPVFTAGQVLTAVQQTQINTGIPVFATTVTRDAAFGGAGEKTLAEGQFAYIEATDTTQYYDGAAWATVGPAAVAASGLTLVTAQTIGNAVASVTVSNAFSSTYENYLIFISGGVGNGNTTMALTLGSTVTGYYSTLIYMNYNANTVNGQGQSNGASWPSSYSSVDNLNGAMTLFGPNLAKNTVMHCEAAGTFTTGETTLRRGYLANTTQYTAFTITTSGTLTGGTVRVYGYQNSQDYMTYKIQIDDLVRDATPDEAARIDAHKAETEAQAEAQAAKDAARQAVLDKLGLTADEAALLLG